MPDGPDESQVFAGGISSADIVDQPANNAETERY
jgi:hypothetical protein